MSETDVLDMSAVAKLRELPGSDSGTLFAELSDIMQNESAKTSAQIQEGRNTMDREALYRVIHRLKGSALYVGGAKLGSLCQKFLGEVKEADAELIQQKLTEIEAAHEELLKALKEEVAKNG